MNTLFAWIAIVGGVIGSLVAFRIVPLDKFIGEGEAQGWYDKYGKIFRILFPAAFIVGLYLLFS